MASYYPISAIIEASVFYVLEERGQDQLEVNAIVAL